jgi:hypothetical protein
MSRTREPARQLVNRKRWPLTAAVTVVRHFPQEQQLAGQTIQLNADVLHGERTEHHVLWL